jgi:hypothetical protein
MRPSILDRVEAEGYRTFERGLWNLNLVGVRTSSRQSGAFDDAFHAVFKDGLGQWVDLAFECTTDPGTYYLNSPLRVSGTAILAPGQYRSAYQLGLHRGQYEALVQRAPVKVFRDSNRDETLDMLPGTLEEGMFGINIHKSGRESVVVGRWSAGCTVLANKSAFDVLMAVARRSAEIWGNSFTYTLLED